MMLFTAMVACNNSDVFEQSHELPEHGWHKDSSIVFSPVLKDTSMVMNIGFSISHNDDFPYSNLWLFVNVENPGGQTQTDTIEYFLAEPDGTWIGSGNTRSLTVHWLYKGGVKLSEAGEYKFKIQQGMRREVLPGVEDFSLWIEPAEKQ